MTLTSESNSNGDFEERLTAFYKKHCPEKLGALLVASVFFFAISRSPPPSLTLCSGKIANCVGPANAEDLAIKYVGREKELFAKLHKK